MKLKCKSKLKRQECIDKTCCYTQLLQSQPDFVELKDIEPKHQRDVLNAYAMKLNPE
eukprot:Pgem_evm1s14560